MRHKKQHQISIQTTLKISLMPGSCQARNWELANVLNKSAKPSHLGDSFDFIGAISERLKASVNMNGPRQYHEPYNSNAKTVPNLLLSTA